MSSGGSTQRLPVVITIVVALMLMVVPLPDWAAPFRPDWVALTLIYWAMMLPRTWSVGSAWIVGIVLDVAQGTILGQHALALCLIVFITVRFHLLMRVFPLQQLAATVFAILALYQFILFWINGVAGIDVPAVDYWGPVITGTLFWPVVLIVLRGVRVRIQLGH
ncbi:MAG: rod shape-determining protein MreD [Gammaproteobacteria bacterium]|nr:rod shape-determining protein MreD [Gammaproteobacteria bacterium]MDH3372995.1 rod shape-determining protein MreD [Gammaproteobacteria bacterium]MDH3408137.1 rod shape-determining protein MreD [Gammaproteobacteria bacterium]MDH3553369.1 rod shape-determining protein MreD [Gammaproteobacteria bacterium]